MTNPDERQMITIVPAKVALQHELLVELSRAHIPVLPFMPHANGQQAEVHWHPDRPAELRLKFI